MTVFKSGLRAAAIVAAGLAVAGCASQRAGGPSAQPSNPGDAAAQAAATSHYKKAVKQYVRAAGQAHQPDKKRQYRLEAGLAAAQGGDTQTAQQLLDGVDPSRLDQTDQARYHLAQREISIADLSPHQALKRLPKPARNTAPAVAQRVWEKRAELHFADHEPVQGIEALVQRDTWLNNDRALRANDNHIYDKSLDAIGLGIGPNSPDAANAGKTARGWLALAEIGQKPFSDRSARDQALADWQDQYSGHPANRSVLRERFDYAEATRVNQKQPAQMGTAIGQAPQPSSDQVAIALPLTGDFKNAAQAIRDGFMFAYKNNNGGMPEPLVYDTSSMAPQALISRAQGDSVGILVGPLSKPKVKAMSNQSLSMPEIALNRTDQASQHPGFYQFGLAPEDEAKSLATHAEQAGYDHALALVPSGDWGDRVLDAFRSALAARGGRLVGYHSYDSNSHDHSQAVQSVLADQDNADFIFVAAQPRQARLIRSQLKYYHAVDLPMLTTSHAFSGSVNPGKDIDLNDVRFVDMPWLLGHGGTITRLRTEAVNTYGDEAKSYARLFAMGMDAWLLARQTDHDGLSRDQPIEGMTGVLSVQPNGNIKRYLGWAVFREGRPQTLSLPSMDQAKTGDNYSQQRPNSRDNGNGNAMPPDSDGRSSRQQPAPPQRTGRNDSWSSGD